jgi:hypothetical protein
MEGKPRRLGMTQISDTQATIIRTERGLTISGTRLTTHSNSSKGVIIESLSQRAQPNTSLDRSLKSLRTERFSPIVAAQLAR